MQPEDTHKQPPMGMDAMRRIIERARPKIECGFHKSHVHLQHALGWNDWQMLRSMCDKLTPHWGDHRACALQYPNGGFYFGYQMVEPSADAIRWLMARNSRIAKLEFVLNLFFKTKAAATRFFRALECLWVTDRSKLDFHLHYDNTTNLDFNRPNEETTMGCSSGSVASGSFMTMYLTWDPREANRYCVHIEIRCSGSAALSKFGIDKTRDLLNYDFRTFWRSQLTLFTVDFRTLAKCYLPKVQFRLLSAEDAVERGRNIFLRFAYDDHVDRYKWRKKSSGKIEEIDPPLRKRNVPYVHSFLRGYLQARRVVNRRSPFKKRVEIEHLLPTHRISTREYAIGTMSMSPV